MLALRSVSTALLVASATWSAAAGCVDEHPQLKPGPSACNGKNCTTGAGVGFTSSSGVGGSSADGGSQAASLDGTVVVTSNETFDAFAPYAGEATIHAPLVKGGEVVAPYGGLSGTQFSLEGLPSGLVWVLVKDESLGGTGVVSTYSSVLLPSASALSLPIVDSSILSSIAMTVGTFVDPDRAQVVLRVRRGGKALSGVSLTSVGDGFVAYDQGPGLYSAGASATATGGVIVLFNVAPQGAAQTVSLTLSDGAKTYTLDPIPALVGGATLTELAL